MKLIQILTVIFLGFATRSVLAESCGQRADADVVIMIDRTGSITSTNLARERAAAKALLGYFSSAILKPRVAIGSFNVVNGSPSARIENNQHLTDDYGTDGQNATRLYAAINGITFSNGRTDLAAPISAAQTELSAHALGDSRHIILITDGIANEVGGPSPSECSGGNPGATARTAAINAKNAGTTIFGIHYNDDGSCPTGTGETFLLGTNLLEPIVSGPEFFYEAETDLSNLSHILIQISQYLGCDDGDPCTADACISETDTCQYTLICQPTPTPTPVPVIDCLGVPGGSAVIDRCGVCAGDGTSCLGCTDVNISSQQVALDSNALSQNNLIQSALRTLARVDDNSRTSRNYIRRTANSAKQLYLDNWHLTYSLPQLFTSCINATFCAQNDNTGVLRKYDNNSTKLYNMAKTVTSRIKRFSSRHTRSANSLVKRAKSMHQRNLTISAALPKISSVCS